MGLLDSLKGLKKEEVARVSVPGETTAELREGKVSLRWEEARGDRNQKNARAPAPADLVVEVSPKSGGGPLDVHPATGGTSGAGGGRIYCAYGHVEVPWDGEYTVRVTTAEQREDPVLILRA